MMYLFYIPLILVLVYTVVLLYKDLTKKTLFWLIGIVFFLIVATILLNTMFATGHTTLVVLGVEILLLFTLIQLQHKPSILFIVLLFVSIGLICFIGIQFYSTIHYISYLMVLLYLLAVNNQIFMRKTYEEAVMEYQNKIINKQVEEVQNMYVTMRGWRHDYHNHLQKLKAHISLDQLSEARDYLNHLEQDLDNVNKLVETGNVNLDAILNSKLSLAMTKDIAIKYDAKVPTNLTVRDIDLCVLIGNLIDNAVEACDNMSEGSNTFIRLYIGIFKKQLYISITNSTNEVIRKLDSEYISKKRGNHGHGLKRINTIVEKYNGYINRQNEPNVFVTEVLLPL